MFRHHFKERRKLGKNRLKLSYVVIYAVAAFVEVVQDVAAEHLDESASAVIP